MSALLFTSDPPVTAEEDAAWADRQALAELAERFKMDASSFGLAAAYSGFAPRPAAQAVPKSAAFTSPADVIVLRRGR